MPTTPAGYRNLAALQLLQDAHDLSITNDADYTARMALTFTAASLLSPPSPHMHGYAIKLLRMDADERENSPSPMIGDASVAEYVATARAIADELEHEMQVARIEELDEIADVMRGVDD